MSNRKLTLLERKERRMRRKCPKCGTTNVARKDYPDEGKVLYICKNEKCHFPWREDAPDA